MFHKGQENVLYLELDEKLIHLLCVFALIRALWCNAWPVFVCFQVVDLYWGVDPEEWDSPELQRLRMKLLEECLKTSAGPCFVVSSTYHTSYSSWCNVMDFVGLFWCYRCSFTLYIMRRKIYQCLPDFFPPSLSISLHGSDMALRLDCSQAIRFWRSNNHLIRVKSNFSCRTVFLWVKSETKNNELCCVIGPLVTVFLCVGASKVCLLCYIMDKRRIYRANFCLRVLPVSSSLA